MSAESLALDRRSPTGWRTIRISVGLTYLACQTAKLAIAPHNGQLASVLESSSFAALGIAATLLAYQSARTFGAGQTARVAWLFIAIMPLSDAIAYLAYTMPAYLGTHSRSSIMVGVATALLSVTRLLAAAAFYFMFRVYRKSGLKLRLRGRDYLAMVLVTVMDVVSLLYASSGARASGGVQLAKIVLITSIPLVIGLVPCAVLGVMIWRYTAEMGGGLVAKAWRGTLLYGVAWLVYIAFHAVVAYYLAFSSNKIVLPATTEFLIRNAVDWMLKGAEYLIFLGASYQFEACTSAPDFSEELNAFASGE